ncbi:hypothetical protein BGZ83_007413 [Gryganskiella cystojenkinii]|nr:hypothetical protein BGZ83_007413 [Gryganskiella cystojenkinii]
MSHNHNTKTTDSSMNMSSGFQPGLGTAIWSSSLTPNSEPEYIGALFGLFLLSIGFRGLVAAQGYLEAYLHLHYYPRHSSTSTATSHRSLNTTYRHQKTAQDAEEGHEARQSEKHDRENYIPNDDDEEEDLSSLSPELSQSRGHQQDQPQHINIRIAESSPSSSIAAPTSQRRYGTDRQQRQSRRPPVYNNSGSVSMAVQSFRPFPTAQSFVWQAELARAVLTTAVVGIGYMLMLVIMTYNSAYFGVILAGIFVGEVYFARWGRARPIFPSSSSSRKTDKHFDTIDYEETSRPLCESNTGAPIPPSFNSTTQQQLAPVSALSSRASVVSTTSSRGYSSTVLHHDGAC